MALRHLTPPKQYPLIRAQYETSRLRTATTYHVVVLPTSPTQYWACPILSIPDTIMQRQHRLRSRLLRSIKVGGTSHD
jgi:hypothetical protein